jgi:hypothetical protein
MNNGKSARLRKAKSDIEAKYPWIDGDCNTMPVRPWHVLDARAKRRRRRRRIARKFTGVVAGTGQPGKACCPTDYAWDKQNRMRRLGSSFQPDPVP